MANWHREWLPEISPIRKVLHPLRHLPVAGPTARLVLWFCLCQLLFLSPVLAQGDDPASETETTGPYLNLAEHHTGEFHLQRDERAVHVAFGTARSPVQYFARGQPEVLFTIPEGFRPATDITWDVTARHVQSDGTPHPTRSGPHVFRMTVDREGRVRYVDDPGVEGVGYLRYRTALAWPLAGTEPRVCERSEPIRQHILESLADLGNGALSCNQVDWDHLSHIRTWLAQEPTAVQHLVVQPHDLLGLTNLTELYVTNVHSDMLAHTPQLLSLGVAGGGSMPRDLLAHTPLLGRLYLTSREERLLDWKWDALARTPHLTSLHLSLRDPTDRVFALLQHVPQLTHLTLDGLAEPLPGDSLAALSNLIHLTVGGRFNPCEAPSLQLPTKLTDFSLRLVVEGAQVACLGNNLVDNWLIHAPTLTRLDIDLRGLANLDTDVLPSLPALTRLTVDVTGATALPPRLLVNLPHLTHLRLHERTNYGWTDEAQEALDLPAGFLASAPHLIELSLDLPRLHHIPRICWLPCQT